MRGRGRHAAARRRHDVDQLRATRRKHPRGEGRDDRLLDVRLLQLPQCAAAREGAGSEVPGQRLGRDRRAHAEFAHEKLLDNVRREVEQLGVVYPVAVDNDYRIWRAFENQYWPAAYFIDKAGRIRYHHFGEGRYAEQDAVVEQLLAEPSR